MVNTTCETAVGVQAAESGVRARRRPCRRGISILWVLLFVPVFIILLGVVVNVGNLWLARVELENGLEAAALAAVMEWAEDPVNTDAARQAGVAYAAANCVRGRALHIAANLGTAATENPNANLDCCVGKEDPCATPAAPPSGNLIFGAIGDEDPDCPVTFNAALEPGCGVGTVLFDASAQGGGPNPPSDDNWWGISFLNTPGTDLTLRITKIEIDLRANPGTSGSFTALPVLSDNVSPHKVGCPPGLEQSDISGFTNPGTQITFSLSGPGNSVLTIDFSADGTNDDGFAPCDRFRFGVGLSNVGPGGNASNDGDGVGADQVGVKVYFSDSTTVEGHFIDTTETSNDCCNPPTTEPVCGSLIVHPAGIPDLPCPPSSAANNNGQSYVLLRGGSGRAFAVRAQAVVPVRSPWCNIFGMNFGVSYVTAHATAVYDCTQQRPRLVRVDKFLCPGSP